MECLIVPKQLHLASTFSIVAFDPSTRDLGVAVQSRYFSVGSVVPWAEADVGAIATQSFVNVSYGPRGLQLLKQGLTVEEVIDKLTRDDEAREFRQVGIVDANGNACVFTGKNCLEWAGSKIGKNYAVQGNILTSEDVVTRMAQKFEVTRGDLADKLIAALEGGEEAGGDARGRQSAALLVVRRNCGRAGYGDRYIDLRVEDHPNPIAELKRLLLLHRIYSLIDEGEEKFAKGDLESSLAVLIKAASPNPNVDDVYVDLGVVYLRLGKKQEAINAFKKALQLNPKMRNLIKQLPKFGWMELSQEIFREIGI
ncbi:MAG: DUF1028 domain-containing protein [Candidatus Bathyarchaeia archaeon]|nr:DUF1028 domain-containing protein [Candidatus Bathyarchaeia archaeon]